MAAAADDGADGRRAALTPRERQVMELAAAEVPLQEAARRLGIKPKTLRAHQASIFLKVGVGRPPKPVMPFVEDGEARVLDDLTEREREVAPLAVEALTYQAGANRLGIAKQTYKNHLTSIYRKTGTTCQTSLAVWVMRQQEPVAPVGISVVTRQELRRRLKDRLWSMPGRYWRGQRYVPLSGVTEIVAEVMGR